MTTNNCENCGHRVGDYCPIWHKCNMEYNQWIPMKANSKYVLYKEDA